MRRTFRKTAHDLRVIYKFEQFRHQKIAFQSFDASQNSYHALRFMSRKWCDALFDA